MGTGKTRKSKSNAPVAAKPALSQEDAATLAHPVTQHLIGTMQKTAAAKRRKAAQKADNKLREAGIATGKAMVYVANAVKPGITKHRAARMAGLAGPPKKDSKAGQVVEQIKRQQLCDMEFRADDVLLELRRLAFIDPRNMVDEEGRPIPFEALDEDTARGIVGLKFEKLYDWEVDQDSGKRNRVLIGATLDMKFAKLGALELLAKHFNLLGGSGGGAKDRLDEIVKAIQASPTGEEEK